VGQRPLGGATLTSMGNLRAAGVGAATGWWLWSGTEYVMHRWGMHGPWRRQPVAAEHLRHHGEPLATDPVLRALSYLPVALGGVGLGAAASRLAGTTFGRAAGLAFVAGYTAYEQLHWRAHHRHPANPPERWLWRRHMAHHARARLNYGVTTAFWDRLAGTAAPEAPVRRARAGHAVA